MTPAAPTPDLARRLEELSQRLEENRKQWEQLAPLLLQIDRHLKELAMRMAGAK